MDLAEQINVITGKHRLEAEELIKNEGLRGADADKVLFNARIETLHDTVTLILREIENLRALAKQ
jgi:hypothetical protein